MIKINGKNYQIALEDKDQVSDYLTQGLSVQGASLLVAIETAYLETDSRHITLSCPTGQVFGSFVRTVKSLTYNGYLFNFHVVRVRNKIDITFCSSGLLKVKDSDLFEVQSQNLRIKENVRKQLTLNYSGYTVVIDDPLLTKQFFQDQIMAKCPKSRIPNKQYADYTSTKPFYYNWVGSRYGDVLYRSCFNKYNCKSMPI
jgi:hypothetical protein